MALQAQGCTGTPSRSCALYTGPVPLPSPVHDALADLMARHLKALAQPVRIQLLAELASGPQTVHELCEATSTTQQNVSKHLGLLHQAGLVSRNQAGAQVVYALADESGIVILERSAEAVARRANEYGAIAQALRARGNRDA